MGLSSLVWIHGERSHPRSKPVMSSTTLTDLPQDAIIQILQYLSVEDWCRIAVCCHTLHNLTSQVKLAGIISL